MIIISHRGNINGPSSVENVPDHVDTVLKQYNVEIDVWMLNDILYLGHDAPLYKISQNFLNRHGLWCHAKNVDALYWLLKEGYHCFWHQTDRHTLTSRGVIWTFPTQTITDRSVIVDLTPNWKEKKYNCCGVCVDYI